MTQSLDSMREKTLNGLSQSDISQYLTFNVSGEEFGVDIMIVREIKGWTGVTRLPNTPNYMRGVMNLRGVIVPIFDLKCRFGGEIAQVTQNSVIIILAVNDRNIGILVDAVSDILSLNLDMVRPAPDIESQAGENFISGLISLEERMVVLLRIENLFNAKDIENAGQKIT